MDSKGEGTDMGGWVKFENTMPESLKLVPLSDRAFRLWIHATCFCSRAESDGLVPRSVLLRLSETAGPKVVQELVDARLLEAIDDGFVVHDYLQYNPSRARIASMREASRERTDRWRDGSRDASQPPDDETHHPRARDRSGSSTTTDKGQETVDARGRVKRAEQGCPPDKFPEELEPVLGEVLAVLRSLQAQRGGNEPTVRGVGLVLARFPDRDHLRVARELEYWVLAGNGLKREIRDWSRQYGAFLDRTPAGSPTRPGVAAPEPSARAHAEWLEQRRQAAA